MTQETRRGQGIAGGLVDRRDKALLVAGASIRRLVEIARERKLSSYGFRDTFDQMLGTFYVSEETATTVFRQLRTFSDPHDVDSWSAIRSQLGIDSKNTSTGVETVAGMLLIAYVGESTRLLGILEGKDDRAIEQQLRKHLGFNPYETTQGTFDRLLQVAIDNSNRIRQPIK